MSNMKTPQGIKIELGQIWERVSAIFNATVKVVGYHPDSGRVQIENEFNGRTTWANISRFNGKSKGYKLVSSPKKQKPKSMWAAMKACQWSTITAFGIEMAAPPGGPSRFIPVFETREQAVAAFGSEDCVQELTIS